MVTCGFVLPCWTVQIQTVSVTEASSVGQHGLEVIAKAHFCPSATTSAPYPAPSSVCCSGIAGTTRVTG